MISCKECRELLPILLDGGLDENQRFALEEHLKACQTCRAEVARIEATIGRLRYAARWQPAIPPSPVIALPSRSLAGWFSVASKIAFTFCFDNFVLSECSYEVLTAYDGVEGLERTQGEGFDLIVMDVMMPRMDSFEMLQRLKTEPQTNSIPVIMLTVRAQDLDTLKSYRYGADLRLPKPFNPMGLVTLMKHFFEQRGNQ